MAITKLNKDFQTSGKDIKYLLISFSRSVTDFEKIVWSGSKDKKLSSEDSFESLKYFDIKPSFDISL